MRIAISGTHRTGKSTLVGELEIRLENWVTFAEPYELMVEDGVEFGHPPSVEDFEAQLRCSMELLREGPADAIFDRCPLDFLGYLLAHRDVGVFRLEDWLDRIRESVASLDLVVFVSVEPGDRIGVDEDDGGLRAQVDDVLRDLVPGDSLQFGMEVLEVQGSVRARADAVLGWLGPL